MTAIFVILGTAAFALFAHLAYGAVLAGREYNRSERAWDNAADKLLPKQARRRLPVAKPVLQRA